MSSAKGSNLSISARGISEIFSANECYYWKYTQAIGATQRVLEGVRWIISRHRFHIRRANKDDKPRMESDIHRIATTPIAAHQLLYSERSSNADHKNVYARPRPDEADTEIKLKISFGIYEKSFSFLLKLLQKMISQSLDIHGREAGVFIIAIDIDTQGQNHHHQWFSAQEDHICVAETDKQLQ
ncbi:hypothetical protein EAF00_002924 [Botryotinia globosa]|nr:hypothetical protein EAF00_002924 [Botryotinia globosa]